MLSRLPFALATPMIRPDVERIPSFAPDTAALDQPAVDCLTLQLLSGVVVVSGLLHSTSIPPTPIARITATLPEIAARSLQDARRIW